MMMQVAAVVWFSPGMLVVNAASWFGTFVYLRFIRVWEGSRGDHSYTFAFENMVPAILKPIASRIGNAVFAIGLKIDRSALLTEWSVNEAPFASVMASNIDYRKQDVERKR